MFKDSITRPQSLQNSKKDPALTFGNKTNLFLLPGWHLVSDLVIGTFSKETQKTNYFEVSRSVPVGLSKET